MMKIQIQIEKNIYAKKLNELKNVHEFNTTSIYNKVFTKISYLHIYIQKIDFP